MRRVALLLAVAGALVSGCDAGAREAEPFQGVWESQGWGMYLLVDGGEVEIFEHTSVHCLSAAAGSARGIADVISLEEDRLVMRDSDRVVRFERIDLLPEECAGAGRSDDPVDVVEVLAATIEEHHIDGVGADWAARVSAARRSAESDLGTALLTLVERVGGTRVAAEDRVSPEPPSLDPPEGAARVVDGIWSGEIGGGIVYFGLERLGPFSSTTEESERLLSAALDEALRGDVVVIDLRAAAGGLPGHALLLATRFVAGDRLVGRMEATSNDGFVWAGDLDVAPSQLGPYDGRTVVLIGAGTAAAGELTALALGDLDDVTLVGAPTAGYPGPLLVRFLPNGWSVAVPNVRVVGPDGEVVGPIEPDEVSDDALSTALQIARAPGSAEDEWRPPTSVATSCCRPRR